MKSEIILIAPQQAESWLANKGQNRKLSVKHVTYLANEIKSGRWRLTHQGVAFGDDGCLLDGQHRLAAIVQAGIATEMMVTYEVPRGEFTIVDRGMPRNLSTITGIPKFATECYQIMIRIAKKHGGRPSPDDVYLLHKYFSTMAEDLQNACGAKTRFFSSAPIRTAAIVSIASGHEDKYILNTYRDLALQNLRTLPNVALALVKTYNRSLISTPSVGKYHGEPMQIEVYAKARYLFTKANANREKIQIGEEQYKLYFKEVTDLVKAALLASPNQEKSQLLKQIGDKEAQIRAIQNKLMKKTALDIEAQQIILSREAAS